MPFIINPYRGGGGAGSPGVITITALAAQAGTVDTTDFILSVDITDVRLKTTGNGGSVTSSSAHDVRFSTDTAGASLLSWTIKKYVASTGQVVALIRIPLSHTSNYVFYMPFGDATITTFQGSVAGSVYDSGYVAAYPLGETSFGSGATDATGNGNNCGTDGFPPSAGTGLMDGCGVFNGERLDAGTSVSLSMTNSFSIEAMVKPAGFGNYGMIAVKGDGPVREYDLDIEQTTGKLRFFITQGSGNYQGFTANTALTTGTWYHCMATYDGTTMRIFRNGVADGTRSQSGNTDATGRSFTIGFLAESPIASSFINASIYDVRISKGVIRTPSYALATYNNGIGTLYSWA